MKTKINYFMSRDTRLFLDNLSKVIIDKNELFIYYTILRRGSLKNEEFVAVNYIKNKNRMIIYDGLKKYNPKLYVGFIEWANEKGIEIFKQKLKEEVKVLW